MSVILKGSSSFPSVSTHGLTDADIRTRVLRQVNGLLPFTDTGARIRTGVATEYVGHFGAA